MSTTAPATSPPIRFAALRGRVPLAWGTVVALAVVLAFANGFVIIALRGATGAIERTQTPFADWLRYSAIMTPMFGLTAIWALARAYRRARRTPATVLIVAAAATAVALLLLIISTAYDYHLQVELLAKTATVHNHTGGAFGVDDSAYADGAWSPGQRMTMLVDIKGIGLGTIFLAAVNTFFVGWIAALRGGRLSRSR